jgi:hypothetical protein
LYGTPLGLTEDWLEQRLALSGMEQKNKIMINTRNIRLFCLREAEGGDPICSVREREGRRETVQVATCEQKERCRRAYGDERWRRQFKGKVWAAQSKYSVVTSY